MKCEALLFSIIILKCFVPAKNETKIVFVPPNVPYPISFLVKAKKLGEMDVRVKAFIRGDLVYDTIGKIIRVTPES